MSNKIVEFKDVVKTYGSEDALQYAVDHISFSIDEGEFVVILGQSGAGKSTVLNMLGGMDTPTSGEVNVANQLVSSMNDKQLGLSLECSLRMRMYQAAKTINMLRIL